MSLFTDRVMAAVTREPRPRPARVSISSIAHLSFRDAAAALSTGWRLTTEADRTITPRGQVNSSAVLLTIVAVLAVGGSFAAADRFLVPSAPVPAAQGPAPELLGGGSLELLPPPSAEPRDDHVDEDTARPDHVRPPHAARQGAVGGGGAAVDVRKGTSGPRVVDRPRTKEPVHRVVRRPDDRDEPGDDRDGRGDDSEDRNDGDGSGHDGSGSGRDGGEESEGSD
jgi:hypothetical protein